MSDENPSITELVEQREAAGPEPLANPTIVQFLKNLTSSIATLPKRAFESSEALRRGEGYDPGPILEAATLPMGTGAIAGVPMRAGEAALGSGALRYKQALERGEITKAEYDEFIKYIGEEPIRAQPPGFQNKSAARVELNRSTRIIEKYSNKDRAHWHENGPALTPTERAEWQQALKKKQVAQQYLDSTQPIELTPVDYDPFKTTPVEQKNTESS